MTSSTSTQEAFLQSAFEAILSGYLEAKKGPFGRASAVWPNFEHIAETLSQIEIEKRRRHIKLQCSIGQGKWANVPWIAALDRRVTDRTSDGIFVIYLFRPDMSEVSLTLNQGASSYKGADGRSRLLESAAKLRRSASALTTRGFTVDDTFSLGGEGKLARSYEDSTVAFKTYRQSRVPKDNALLSDFAAAMEAYESLV